MDEVLLILELAFFDSLKFMRIFSVLTEVKSDWEKG